MTQLLRSSACLMVCLGLFSCGGSADNENEPTPVFPNVGDEQTPPTKGDATAMRKWLDAGHYNKWQCESEAHPPRGPSSHHMNRSCSNNLISSFSRTKEDERPAGSAAVKEFWDQGKVYGHAVYVKTAAKSDGGDSWYWYVEIDGMGVLANGLGSQDATAKKACAACHAAAGSDTAHTTSKRSGDFVYTQVET